MPPGEDKVDRLERIDRLLDGVIGEVWKAANDELSALAGVSEPSGAARKAGASDLTPAEGQRPDISPAERRELDLELALERDVPVLGEVYNEAAVWLDHSARALAAGKESTPECAKAIALLQSMRLGAAGGNLWTEVAASIEADRSAESAGTSELATQTKTLILHLEEVLTATRSEAYSLIALPMYVAYACTGRKTTRRLAAARVRILQGLAPAVERV
jgi:hypothetical protein